MSASDIVAAVNCVAQFTVAPIVKQVKYVVDYKENLANLPKEVEKLMDLKQEVEGLVSSAQRNAEDIKPSVEAWVKEVDLVAEASCQMIREEEEHSKKRCFTGICPNPVSRHGSSRRAFKETVQILQLQTAGREFKEGSVSFPVSAAPSFPVTVTLGKDFLDFNSRSKTWEEIMKALRDPDANVIGVYGMGGLGKTTLVKQVVARAVEEKLFDEVVMPVVTHKNVRDVEEFQGEMAKVLGMKLDDQWSVSQRADRIFKRLTQKTGDEKTEKKTIVILDDLRAKLDLEQVGIPFGAGIKGCKILFTSRFRYVSYAAQKVFTLGVLEEEEAWRLFQKTAGDVLEDPTFFNVGKDVTKNCKGLPILIVTVAGALLQRRSLGAWKDALIRLQQEGSKETQEFVDSALEFISFNHLPHANKSLFLLCGLVGRGQIYIYDLLKYGIGWGLFRHTKTMEEARNNLETLILDLKASFLLLDGQSIDVVIMHDVVRDVAIKIASNEDHNMLVGSSEEWPEEDTLKRCTALTFHDFIVPELPECLECPSLELLMLPHNNSLPKIVNNAFEKMQKLTVLDITSTDLSLALPSSLALLQNLQTLSLDHCKLGDISVVGALKKLKILSLICASIEKLPMEIGDLSELRVLDLNGCSELKVIPPGVIKRLSRLEELLIGNSYKQWEVEGLEYTQRSNASLDELNYLPKLSTLRVHIPDVKLLPKDFSFKKLERFTILIGDEEWDWKCHDDRSLYRFRGIKIKINGSRDIHLEAVVKEILKRTEILYLDGMKNIHELEWKSFRELKFAHIQHSAETRYIVNVMEYFPAGLESLCLNDLPQLQNLWRGRFMAESSFSKLKYVNVSCCNSLRSLFSFSMARGLLHLEKLEVTNCDSLEAIVEDTREDDKNGDTVIDKLEFRQLRSLILERLPKLASFCSNVTNCSMESDEVGPEGGCRIVAPFFSEKVSFPKLEKLTLKGCDGMEYLFNQSIVTGLEQLNIIAIDSCKSLKGMVAQVEGEETNETIKFPQLVDLSLSWLPCFTRLCSGCCIVFPTLTELSIRGCEQLKTLVWADTKSEDKTMISLFNEKVELPNLKDLHISFLDNVETIWHDRLHEDSFFKLEQLVIYRCPSLVKIFPSTMLRRIHSLEELRLLDNWLVEEVFENDETTKPNISQGGETTEDDKIIFSQLRILDLTNLSNLKRFCSGSCVVFPALIQLEINCCKKIETFMSPIPDMDSNDMQPLFHEKVEFPSLTNLQLGELDNIKIVWDSRIHEDSCSTLERVSIELCGNLLRIFPLAMLGRIQSLKELWISYCCSVEEIFEAPTNTQWPHPNETIDVMLSVLYLENVPKLKWVGRGDLLQILNFRNLREVAVDDCESLKYLFPAQQLYHLEKLSIYNCGLETIVCQKEIVVSESAEDEIVFSRLKTLELTRLSSLVNFYLGNCILKFPLLENVTVNECINMKTFCGGITITPKLETVCLNFKEMDIKGDEEDKDLNTTIKEAYRLTTEVEDDICENSNEPGTKTKGIVTEPGKKSETCVDDVKCSKKIAEMNGEATKSSVEAESSKMASEPIKNDGICGMIIEPRKLVHTYDKAMEPRKEACKVDEEGVELRKEGEFCKEIVEPREEIDTCKEIVKARNESETIPKHLLRPSLFKETQGSQAPPPDIVDATCHLTLGTGVEATTCQQSNEFQGLQVTQHLVPLLEKAHDKHGDFHNSPLIKSKIVRIAAMESVGQVLHILQTQTPRTMDAEKIKFMEEAFHDVSNMSFPIEWLRPLIDRASKCLGRKERIDEMEAQVQALKREIEKALVDLDQPLLDF